GPEGRRLKGPDLHRGEVGQLRASSLFFPKRHPVSSSPRTSERRNPVRGTTLQPRFGALLPACVPSRHSGDGAHVPRRAENLALCAAAADLGSILFIDSL